MKILGPDTHSARATVSVDAISDPTAVGASIDLLEQETVQLQPLPLRARRVTVRLEGRA